MKLSRNRRVLLHAGLPKTGTTSIQAAFHAERRLLLKSAGILYPSLNANLTDALCTLFHDDPRQHITNRLQGVKTPEALATLRRNYQEELEDEIRSTRWETLLLSAEGVSNLSHHELARLREWGDQFASHWTVIFCVRHPVDFFRSHSQELVKLGSTLEWLYEHSVPPRFRAKVANLVAAFGRSSVLIYDFESANEHPSGIVGAFAERAGVPHPLRGRLVAQEVRKNRSLSHEAVLLLDSINRQRPRLADDVPAPRRSGHELQYLHRIRGNRFHIPAALEHEIRTRSRSDIQWLNAEFGLDLYPDVVNESLPDSTVHAAEPSLGRETIDDLAILIAELVATNEFQRHFEQGRLAASRGDVATARKHLSEAARLNPDAPQPRQWMARLHEHSGPFHRPARWFRVLRARIRRAMSA